MKRVVLFSILMLSPACAQQAPLPAEYNLKLLPAEVDTVGKALGKLPFDEVQSLIAKLREQISAQQQAAQKVAEPEKK